MRNRSIPALASLLLLGTALQAAQAPSDAFFPSEKGSRWVYDTFDKKTNKHFDMKVVVESASTAGGVAEMVLTQKDERGTMREFLLKNEKGIFIVKLGWVYKNTCNSNIVIFSTNFH